MTSFTAADLKLGGRLMAACDAMGEGKLRKAAGIFAEVADDLNVEAETTTGLLAPDEDDWSAPLPAAKSAAPQRLASSGDLQMCARNVHAFGPEAPVTGWRTCMVCGQVNITPGGGGPIDMGMAR